ncbi:hypothetical protein C1752_00576 [Acaryochloris thomasi RCC1774]|uniref:Uncharacterized protein n=2 Tax=Acaryochloris TaxID=155977 RepID=A0A2W1JWJ5_9CYAN|nr:hypothetical protein C1752_00576 [Acaryochloris thomasi RCC1774]
MLLPLNLFLMLPMMACSDENSGGADNDIPELSQQPLERSDSTSVERESATDGAVEASAEGSADLVLALSGEGLLVIEEQSGKARSISFDTDLATAQAAVSATLGQPTEIAQENECGAGPMSFISWPNGLTMNAMQNQFVGWSVRPEAESANLTTVDGIGLGKTLTDLEASYRVDVIESSLGTEFNASDSLFGLLSNNQPKGVITHLWSGIACNFR